MNAIATFLNSITSSNDPMDAMRNLQIDEHNLEYLIKTKQEIKQREARERILQYKQRIERATAGVKLELNCELEEVKSEFTQGNFVVAYYRADRVFSAMEPKYVEKVSLKSDYLINEKPREEFIKYLLDLKMTEALALSNNKREKAEKINLWFEKFEGLLKKIFEDESVRLEFDEDSFKFRILMSGREAFDFNTLSSGYAAVLDIVVDLIIRMEKQTNKVFDFLIPGIVLIDEVETHLHLELQKKILELLITIFPNIQFIVSTHSPFILSSLEDVTIYDLEKHILVKDGLADVPYSGIVERSFPAPESLAIEAQKASGSYEKDDVVERLRKDFHDKCYICEINNLQDPQVEHLLPHKSGRFPESKFALRKIKALLRRGSRFAAFKRSYIRENQQKYPNLLEYIV